jgi:sterol desaturase/sphingolipid hydroxylase (fatty acid hydroxylase superfamily)
VIDWIILQAKSVAVATLWPLHELVNDGQSRFFWLYCLTGIIAVAYVHQLRRSERRWQDIMFDRETWTGRSARNDYFVLVMGSVLRMTVLSWAFLNGKAIAETIASVLAMVGVAGTVTDTSAVVLGFMLTVSLFLVDDFLRWWIHYLMHKVPELWEYHKVHHSAEVLNFATAERFHPVETIITAGIMTIGIAIVNGVFIAVAGRHLTPVTVFGANVFLFTFNIFGGVLRHAPYWVSFGPKVERWVISPAMHQIHHSEEERHFDTNLGGSLSIWDRWFGTIYIPAGQEAIRYGIGPETKEYRTLKGLYVRPIVLSLVVLARRLKALGMSQPTRETASAKL